MSDAVRRDSWHRASLCYPMSKLQADMAGERDWMVARSFRLSARRQLYGDVQLALAAGIGRMMCDVGMKNMHIRSVGFGFRSRERGP